MSEAWETANEIAAARNRFSSAIEGYIAPAAYSVARVDAAGLVYGYVNSPGEVHRLPAAVLAGVCGYVATTGTFQLSRTQLARAVDLLSPAAAATYIDHPNLWSWQDLLEGGQPDSEFVAFFVTYLADPPVNRDDAAFRKLIGSRLQPGAPVRAT